MYDSKTFKLAINVLQGLNGMLFYIGITHWDNGATPIILLPFACLIAFVFLFSVQVD